jgi:hypothetical protein
MSAEHVVVANSVIKMILTFAKIALPVITKSKTLQLLWFANLVQQESILSQQ